MIRPVELELGEPHVDPRPGPPPSTSGDGFLFAETWAAAADALARDPALALAPLRALRDRRFVRPHPGANGWPDAAVPALFAALDASRACAAASPTLAGDLWGHAAALLAAWARWHAPAGVAANRNGPPMDDGFGANDATLSRIVDVVASDVARHRGLNGIDTGIDAQSIGGNRFRFHVPGGPLGSAPALCLACVAASRAATRETRKRALLSATEIVSSLNPENAFAAAADARALAASLAYLCAAAEQIHGDDASRDALETASGEIARVFFPLWRSDGGGAGEPPSAGAASAAAVAAHRAGLLCARATHATATRFFPLVLESLARNARDVLLRSAGTFGGGGDVEMSVWANSHPGAAFVATGAFLACRRPFFVSGEPSSSSELFLRALDVDALRIAEAHAAEAVEAAARVSSSLAADDALGDAVADAWSHVLGSIDQTPDPVAAARLRLARSALAAGALGASRCIAERAFDPDAFSFLERNVDGSSRAMERDRARKEACLAATVSGAYRFASLPLSALATCFAKNVDPASASVAVASASSVPLAARAHALIELACASSRRPEEADDERALSFETRSFRETDEKNFASYLSRATKKFAKDWHEGYAFFLASRHVGPWRDALDATATRSAFANARLAVVTACEYLTKTALDADPKKDVSLDASFEDASNDAKKNVSLLLAACDALARVEFARGSEVETHTPRSVTSAIANAARAQMASGRYALALTRLAAALGAPTSTGAAFREGFLSSSVPKVDEFRGGFETPGAAKSHLLLFDSRANVYLRLFPYAAVRDPLGTNAPGALFAKRALPLASHYVSHQSPTYARAAHLAHAAAFRADPAETIPIWFSPYVHSSLEMLYGASAFGSDGGGNRVALASTEEAFASTVGVVAERGGATAAGRAAVAAAARAFVERAARLDTQSSRTKNAAERHDTAAAARTLRRLVFSLLTLVDHALVPEVQSAAEEAVLSCDGVGGEKIQAARRGGTEPPRIAAYADLVRSVMAIGDVARKSAATQWALRLRARI